MFHTYPRVRAHLVIIISVATSFGYYRQWFYRNALREELTSSTIRVWMNEILSISLPFSLSLDKLKRYNLIYSLPLHSLRFQNGTRNPDTRSPFKAIRVESSLLYSDFNSVSCSYYTQSYLVPWDYFMFYSEREWAPEFITSFCLKNSCILLVPKFLSPNVSFILFFLSFCCWNSQLYDFWSTWLIIDHLSCFYCILFIKNNF